MNNINVIPALPEVFMAVMIVLILLVDAFISEKKKPIITVLTLVTLVVAYIIQLLIFSKQSQFAFNGMFILDMLAEGTKLFTYIVSIIIVLYVQQYIIDKKLQRGEFYLIFLFAVLGMDVMISANNMLVLYVGLELLSLALYALVALNRDNIKSVEAAMKFFILGALGSGLLLFGISFIYGATNGQLQLQDVFGFIYQTHGQNKSLLVFGLVFIVSGLVFKLGLVPFHMWIPDVYDGAPLATTTIIGTVTKIAGIVFMIRFLINGLVILSHEWSVMLELLAILSLFLGNIVAISQTNIKRMLGYSTISHMGFIALGLMTVSIDGISAMLFYTFVYVITALAGFGVLTMLSHGSYECENIDDLKGLNRTHPLLAGILLLVMFSMAGIPPLAGFYAKFKILEALMALGFIKLAVYSVIMSLIGAFYYLRIVKVMYFDENTITLRLSDINVVSRTVLTLNGIALLVIGIIPSAMMSLCLNLITG
jgi:NADH-quinone oxidoreductase subunit N